jgi:hypothetical protein
MSDQMPHVGPTGRIGDSRRALEDARLHAQLIDELNAKFEEAVAAGLERYENEAAYHHRVTAIANALTRDELLSRLVLDHPTRSHLAKRLALRAVVADDIIIRPQRASGGVIHHTGVDFPRPRL